VTGAPKIRAMEIIDELEPTRRGAYCGAIGYLDSDGTIEFSVAIRTMTIKDGIAYVPVGGGVVADSVPEQEYEETLVKAQAMLRALGVSVS
jgi:para-aminobenzoate synthetase component 1